MTYIRLDVTTNEVIPPGNLYHVCTDAEVNRINRIKDPMVWEFSEVAVQLTREWQFFIRAINPGMTLQYVSALLNTGRAFCNGTSGFNSIPLKNFILGKDLRANELPKFDEVRTCGGSTIRMINGYVQMLNGNQPPPLKLGALQPQSISEATLDRYLYTPQTNPELFFAAVYTGTDLLPRPFPNGAIYSWYKSGLTPVSFLPHVCPGGQVAYPPQLPGANTPTLKPI